MLNLLHYFLPQPLLLAIGPLTIHWYGLCLVLAIAAALGITLKLSREQKINQEQVLDLAIWLIIGGLLGARIYEIFLEWPYYFQNPAAIIKIWEGGLAIHGAIIGGGSALLIFARKNKLSSLKLTALIVPGLALGQAIGRWGNWFNQELFGLPTALPWGIPIALENRPLNYINYNFFHPTFLYESLGCLFIFLILSIMYYRWRRHLDKKKLIIIINTYLLGYALLRFSLEFIKIDQTPLVGGWRWPQIISLLIAAFSITWLVKTFKFEK